MYRIAVRILKNDEHSHRVIESGRIAAPYYSPCGQAMIPAALSQSDAPDYIGTNYRGTHDIIAIGVPLKVSFFT
jgi:pyruvate dehydrogenase E1 component alpha subunit